ncbi:histidine phosphatase family protein [Falsiroseomonas oryziterrae]|uniref:histidine phosphatase family protein n=1 Tax=Falsiroseomonas oryziterrae TaxID=2911368 RepID=UPI001F3B0A26|nr:histidine phosphatase family protein [Roseomonas sp. NPKOSM-4]
MRTLLFVTHPEVAIDPAVPVPRWHLRESGIAKLRRFAAGGAIAGVGHVWASTECKAIESAGILAGALGLGLRVREDLGENDRSATGFLPPDEFETMADAFFANPEQSVRGWERAVDAQARIVNAARAVVAESGPAGDILVAAHGAVGSLLRGHLLSAPISRALDQPAPGCWFAVELPGWRLLTPEWQVLPPG